MIEHYNAFISYKHAPEDNRIAEAVHKGLERFHIPRKIRKKTGIKRIKRIFRDKDELPITSDLSDSISNALADSDYLIVICSTNTKESVWVPREIEFFLKNHSKKDIFTVLVNGEPYDVIPDILKYEDVIVKDENGEERTVRMPTEPLSCDFRMPLRKAKKTELTRLACGIIGCAYDELMNRRRQYKMKQFMAIVAIILTVMAVFSGYMYYSRNRIHETYLESLKNQSKYLANEAEGYLEKEQRITALQLALEALPKGEGDDRPVTAEAVKALTDATLAYEGNNGNNINAAWNYRMPGNVEDFKLSSDGKKIAIIDQGDVVGVWDTEDHKRTIYLDTPEAPVIGMGFLDETGFAVWDNQGMTCYDTAGGEKLWEYVVEADMISSGGSLMVDKDALYVGTYNREFLKLDIRSGKLISKIPLSEKEGYEDYSFVECKLSPDGKKIAFRCLGGWNDYAYGVLNLDTKETRISEPVEEMIKDIEWIDNDTLVMASTVIDMAGSMSVGSQQLISTDHSTIKCVGAADLSEKWNADFVCNGVMIESGFVILGKDSIAYFSGNVVSVYDPATGEHKYSSNVNDSVIDVSDRDGDGTPTYITENGGSAAPALNVDEDAVYYNKYFADELRKVVISNGVYARQRYGHEVIYYGIHVFDEEWTPLCDDSTLSETPIESYLDEKCLVLLTQEDDVPVVDIYGMDEKAQHFRTKLDGERVYGYKILGVRGNKAYIGYNNNSRSYDVESIDITTQELKKEFSFEMAAEFDDTLVMKNGKLVCLYSTEDYKKFIAIHDIDAGEKKEIEIHEEVGRIKSALGYYEELGVVYLQGEGDHIIDTESGSDITVQEPEGLDDVSCYSDNSQSGLFAVSDGKKIHMINREGKISNTIRCPGVTPLGMTFAGDSLIVLYSDGSLYWYRTNSPEFTKKSDASIYNNYSGEVLFDHDEAEGLLFIRMDIVTDVVDMESGVETACVLNCFGHHKGRDIFITTAKESGEDPRVGYYRRYSVDELIDKAHGILNGIELPDDMRSRYGISNDNEVKGKKYSFL